MQADYDLLNMRLASNLELDWNSEKWKSAPVIVSENAMKDAFNEEMATDFSRRSGQPLHWYYSVDMHSKNRPIESEELKERLARLDSGKTGYRLARIPLVIGMPVIMSQNFDVPGE
jgi:hypothetical protein